MYLSKITTVVVYQKKLRIVNWTFNTEPLRTIRRFWSISQHIAWAQRQRNTLQRILIASALYPFTAFSLSSDCFLCFCFSCLWYLPSSSSSGLPQPSHGCPECKVAWCWSLLLVGVMVFCLWSVSQSVNHPFVVAFVVRPLICSVLALSWCLSTLWSLWFLSMLLILNPPQLLSLK